MKRRRPLLVLAPLLAIAVTACGTTLDDKDFTLQSGRGSEVASDGSSVAGGDGSGEDAGTTLEDGTVVGGTSPDGTVAGTDGSTTTGGATTTGGGSTGGTTSGGATTGGAKPGASSAPVKAAPKAVDAALAPVEVGILYYPDANAAAAKFGSNVDFGDPESQTKATVDYLNANGGFAGHKIIPVFHAVQTSDTAPYATLEQQACDDWTQDHHVVAGIIVGNVPPNIQACMNDRKAVVYTTGYYMHDAVDYKTWPFMVNESELKADDQNTALVESLFKRGFFKPGDKIGVFSEDYPAAKRAYDNGLVPALKKHGLTVTDVYQGHFPESNAELASALASLQTPTLKFQTEGINKILFAGNGEMGTVMQYAESNGYHPQYGFTSNEAPATREANQVAHTQLPGAMGIGYTPIQDITVNPPADNATAQTCLKIMEPISGANSVASKTAAFHYCGTLLFMAAGAAQNPQTSFNGDALRIGIGKLGTSFTHPFSFGNNLLSNHRAGVAAARDMAYDTGCFCFKYTSGNVAVG